MSFTVLDLCAGGFGASWGYVLAGATVTAVDIVERAHRPDTDRITFVKADVVDVVKDHAYLQSFDLVAGSPPCKVHTRLRHLVEAQGGKPIHPDLLGPVRAELLAAGVPYVLENVEGAPLRPDVRLCGSMFGLHTHDSAGARRWLRRHRLFELGGWGNHGMAIQPEPCCSCMSGCSRPMCGHRIAGGRPLGIYGSKNDQAPDGGQTCETLDQARELMGAPWMSWGAITQAIPPAYTHHLGAAFLAESMAGVA